LDQVFCETLRMFPPIQRANRVCNETSEVGGYKVPVGTIVYLGIWGIHHDEAYWPEPETFDPDRFSPENKSKIVPYSWLPFGTGPRNCIGMRLATLEAKIGIAYVIKNFRLKRSPNTEDPPVLRAFSLTTPKSGKIHIRIERR